MNIEAAARDTLTASDPHGWYLCDWTAGVTECKWWNGTALSDVQDGGVWDEWYAPKEFTNFRGPLVLGNPALFAEREPGSASPAFSFTREEVLETLSRN